MTGPVIAGRDGSVRHIRCANKADFTVICIVGGFRNLFRLFFALSRRIGYGTLGRIGIAVAIPSSTSPAASAPITPKRADVRIPLRLSLPLLVRTSSSASTTTTVMALRSGGSLGRLGVGHWGGGLVGVGSGFSSDEVEGGWDEFSPGKGSCWGSFNRAQISSFSCLHSLR